MMRMLPVMAVVVVVTDATLFGTGVIGPGVALALFLAVEVPLGAVVAAGYVRRFRARRAAGDTPRQAWRALAADDPYLRMIVAEARTLASLGRWIARRPDVPAGAVPISYWRGTLGIPVALAVAALIELIAFHLLIPWPTVRLVLDVLGVYALVVVLGWLAGRIVRPHLVHGGELVLRSGTHVCARVPLDAVAAVRRDRRLSPTEVGIEDVGERGGVDGESALALPGPDGSSVTLQLARSTEATVPGYPWSRAETHEVEAVWLHVDDPEEAIRAITAALSSPHR